MHGSRLSPGQRIGLSFIQGGSATSHGHSKRPAPGLLRLIEDDDSRELRTDLVRRLRNMLAVLIAVADMTGVAGPPGWRIHQLKSDRAGTWSISVSGNWRLTFDVRQGEIYDLDLKDYH